MHKKTEHPTPTCRLIRWPELQGLTGLSRVTVWRREKEGRFPQRIDLGGNRAVAWRSEEVTRWLENPAAFRAEG